MTTTDDSYRVSAPDGAEAKLRDADARVRLAAVTELSRTTVPGCVDALAWALADADAAVRRRAAAALRDLPELHLGEDGAQALLLATGSSDRVVRRTARSVLALLTGSARELYAQGLHDGEPHIRVQAVLALAVVRAVGDVAEAADDPARVVRVAAAHALANIGPARGRVAAALEQLLGDHDLVVRMAALDAAADLGLPGPLAERTAELISHSSWQVRQRAARTLCAGEPEVCVPALTVALRDRIVDVRRAAVESLSGWASFHPDAVIALTEALNDPDPGVRTQARWALA